MRTLARGIYPPLLEAEGLGPAVTALARQSTLPVSVETTLDRYPGHIESTVYFCIADALQEIVKHAHARSVHIWLREEEGVLIFTIRHDGTPLHTDPTGDGAVMLADRLDAVLGRGEIDRADGGTTVTGRVPVPVEVAR
jgi:signal transduction histidine kinase